MKGPYRKLVVAAIAALVLAIVGVIWTRARQPEEPTPGGALPPGAAPADPSKKPAGDTAAVDPGPRAPAADDRPFVRPPCQPYGTVRWEDGSPAGGARIEVFVDPRYEATRRMWIDTGVVSNESGAYEMPQQPSCPMRMAASLPGRGRGEESFDLGSEGPPMEGRVLRDLVLLPARSLEGRVVDPDGNPLEGVELAMATASAVAWRDTNASTAEDPFSDAALADALMKGWARTALSDASGRFAFDAVAAGDWVVRGEGESHEPAMETVSLAQDGPPPNVELVLEPIQPWVVRVTRRDGGPVPEARVGVGERGPGPDESLTGTARTVTDTTDPRGEAYFEVSCRPRCIVTAEADGLSHASTILEDTPKTAVEFALGPAGEVRGTVDPQPDEPMSCLVMRRPTDLTQMRNDDAMSVRWLEVAEDGSFRLEHVPAGGMELELTCGLARSNLRLDLTAGQDLDLGTVTLESMDR